MIVVNIPQHLSDGSANPEWLRTRLGLPTASELHRIITPAQLEPSTSMKGYINELIAEQLLGHPIEDKSTKWMERGTILENDARRWYSFTRNVAVSQPGFCVHDDGLSGCSPDGLVGKTGGLEIKVPSPAMQVLYMLDPGALVAKYRLQVNAFFYVTGREWCDLLAFNPSDSMQNVCVRVEPDPEVQLALRLALDDFHKKLADAFEMVRALGCKDAPPLGAKCRHERAVDDKRWCLVTKGLTWTGLGWRCPKHAPAENPDPPGVAADDPAAPGN